MDGYSVFSYYTKFATSLILIQTVLNEIRNVINRIIPQQVQEKIRSRIGNFLGTSSSEMTLVIDESDGVNMNRIYEAAENFLQKKSINKPVKKLKVSLLHQQKNLKFTVSNGEEMVDTFQGMQFRWKTVSTERQESENTRIGRRTVELSFEEKNKEKAMNSYLPYVLETSEAMKEENKVLQLYTLRGHGIGWGSTNLDHPSTFETLAMDPKLKEDIINDLDRFKRRRNFYRRVGKAWKRGYLLFGPPGTGKSSLVAAIANHLRFDIYDIELTSIGSNLSLRTMLSSIRNKSILVIEDVDCGLDLQDRQTRKYNESDSQLTLSGVLNFIDGLWSSCGDERIFVFTTNHKDRLDPALLRPGRMDMHIHMSYCSPCGFRILASNYLQISDHPLFPEIEKLIMDAEVTPAQIAEELMKGEEIDAVLEGTAEFLQEMVNKALGGGGGREVDGQKKEEINQTQ